MSVKVIRWAYQQKIGSAAGKAVLVALADTADDEGRCFPSYKTIAERTELSRRAVMKWVKTLEEAGFIEKDFRKSCNGDATSNRYRLKVDWGGEPRSPPSEPHSPPGAPDSPPLVNHVHHPPAFKTSGARAICGLERGGQIPNHQYEPSYNHHHYILSTKILRGGGQNSAEVDRGGGEFSGEGQIELPQPGPPEPERADRDGDEANQARQDLDALIYPDKLDPDEKRLAQAIIENAPLDQRQDILDELAGLIESDQIRKSPLSVLRGIVRRAQDGEFAPELALGVKRARKAKKSAEKRREAAIRASPVQRGAPTTSKEAFRAMKQALGRR